MYAQRAMMMSEWWLAGDGSKAQQLGQYKARALDAAPRVVSAWVGYMGGSAESTRTASKIEQLAKSSSSYALSVAYDLGTRKQSVWPDGPCTVRNPATIDCVKQDNLSPARAARKKG